ncbi:MAG: hypothetical protein AB7G75_05085 [Candidatus Binatia bacterium]
MQSIRTPTCVNYETGRSALSGRYVLVSIPTGFQLRQFVHSGIVDMLQARGIQVAVVSPAHGGEGFANELPAGVELHSVNLTPGVLRRRYWVARQHLLLDSEPTATLRQKRRDLRRRYWGVALMTHATNRVLRQVPWLRRKLLRWEQLILRDRDLETIVARRPFDLMLLGSPGYEKQDAFLLHLAVRRRIPVAAAILSWDNLSSKGVVNPSPDRLFVWSDHMRHEAITLQGIAADRIIKTGTAVHDVFAHADRFGSRAENLRRLGLDPQRHLLFYGSSHGGNLSDEVEFVKDIARWVETDALGVPCQLWVRLHPQAVSGPYKIPIEPYLQLASPRVKIELPPVRNSALMWDLPQNDLTHLVALLRDASVVVNIGSTLSIDAAILDRPVISLGYDPCGELPYDRSVRRYYSYTHVSHLVRVGAVQIATSSNDLRDKITTYLKQPELDKDGRRRIVEQIFGQVDGRSAHRIVSALCAMLTSPLVSSNGARGHDA